MTNTLLLDVDLLTQLPIYSAKNSHLFGQQDVIVK
uniref:Uncharacterized protein n=1 Tax=Moniliophthora roreri TaxID=221103 RepID=A0A0W0FPL9_MONRR